MPDKITLYDQSDMHSAILATPKQFAEGFALAKKIKISSKFNKIMISGMGGSALPGNILRTYLASNENLTKNKNHDIIKIYQNRFYKLPHEAYNNCLNIICSHSGNTEETIASFQEALDNNLPCLGISAGGKIEEMCRENNIPHIKLPIPFDNFQPRMATGHFTAAIIQILINTAKLQDTTKAILDSAELLMSSMPALEEQGRILAKKLIGKTPIIYSSIEFKPLSLIWKIKFNENSKTPAFWNVFPELNHNEFVGFTNPQANYFIIMLRNPEGHPRNLKRYDATAKFLENKGIKIETIDIATGETIYKLFSSLALCDWTSYYLALEYKIDPTPVAMVEDLKKELAK
jgi:glucose/mannose-6-phosphate isomerase